MTKQAKDNSDLELRRVGEYGHFVMPLSQLLGDLGAFLEGVDLHVFNGEIVCIERADQGIHPEEAAVLYALVRAFKPSLMLETGTFKGYSSSEIARALRVNQSGRLITVDIDPDSGSLVPDDLRPFITFFSGIPSRDLQPFFEKESLKIDIFFHDSLHTYMNTLEELICFAPFLKDNAVILCHDAKMDFSPEFGVGRALREFAGVLDLSYRILDTTCGLGVIRWSTSALPALDKLRSEYAVRVKKKRISDLVHRFTGLLEVWWARRGSKRDG